MSFNVIFDCFVFVNIVPLIYHCVLAFILAGYYLLAWINILMSRMLIYRIYRMLTLVNFTAMAMFLNIFYTFLCYIDFY